ncbi:MAG: DUF3540 domain-containing protein [Deltaproteobacteria bacterium]|nr:DUF3540 domain-containing protein [Deltaproteobacteria bacterium]
MNGLKNVARLRPQWAAEPTAQAMILDKARVIKIDPDSILLLTQGGVALSGQKAAGCLLNPEIGDTVLIVREPSESAFILNILVRGATPGRIVIQGDITLESQGGVLRLGGESVELAARESASVKAPRVNLQGVRGEATFHSFSFIADQVLGRMKRLSVVAQTIDTVAERLVQRLKDCFRRVEGMDETRAGQVNIKARELMNLRAGDASITAENDVKVDGATIRLG